MNKLVFHFGAGPQKELAENFVSLAIFTSHLSALRKKDVTDLFLTEKAFTNLP